MKPASGEEEEWGGALVYRGGGIRRCISAERRRNPLVYRRKEVH